MGCLIRNIKPGAPVIVQPPQPSKGGLSNTHNLEAKISANTYAPLIAFKKPPLGDLGGWIIKPRSTDSCAFDDWFGVDEDL